MIEKIIVSLAILVSFSVVVHSIVSRPYPTTEVCSKPSLESSSKFYQTTCPTPYGTGIKQFIFIYNSESYNNKFSHAPPTVTSPSFSECQANITINGNNFGNTSSVLQVYFDGIDMELPSICNFTT
ncbi:hypothetical protein ACTA71_009384 [Dictyostelium dimigraforme]